MFYKSTRGDKRVRARQCSPLSQHYSHRIGFYYNFVLREVDLKKKKKSLCSYCLAVKDFSAAMELKAIANNI